MRIRQLGLCLLTTLGLLHASSSSAISLDFLPSNTSVFVSDSFTVDVVVSGLNEGAGEVVSVFDLDVLYDPTVLNATGVIFGAELGANVSTDPFDFFADALVETVLSAGRIDFAELSYLFDFELQSLQDEDVLLATLSFDAIGVGVSSLIFDPNTPPGVDVKDGFFSRIDFDSVGDGSVEVSVIPVPGAAILMLTGLLGIGLAGRKRNIQA